jgi:hypothetical protein
MAFWTCRQDVASLEHVHDYDEYMLVVQGAGLLHADHKRGAHSGAIVVPWVCEAISGQPSKGRALRAFANSTTLQGRYSAIANPTMSASDATAFKISET